MYVYFIKCCNEDGYIKIGVSIDPKERMSALSTASPYELKILCTIDLCTPEAAYIAERKLHKMFKSNQIKYEWFSPEIYDQATYECEKLLLESQQFNSEHKWNASFDSKDIPVFIMSSSGYSEY